jgi:hypothetical protein
MALALLTILLRHRDGWDITLAKIGAKYGYGRDAMANAMGLLQVARYVVKIRLMSAENNQWSTEVCVYDTPATDAEIDALLAEASKEPGVRVVQVIEPTKSALGNAAKRRAKLQPKGRQRTTPSVTVPRVSENPDSGATCGNEASSQVSPECGVSRQSGDPAVFKKTVGKKTVDETRDAPSARSAVDERSSSTTGSSAREAEGGSAASSNDHPAPNTDSPRPQAGKKNSSKGKHTREQLDQVRAVRAFFPADLLNGWTNPATGQTIPPMPDVPVLSQAILDALAGDVPAADRTVDQLGARIQQRWNEHGWASKFYASEIDSLVGAAVAMVRPLKSTDRYGCGNPRCEAGRDVDTGVECHVCPERLAARRKARRSEAQTAAGEANTPSTDAGTAPASPVPAQRDSIILHTPVARRECAEDTCALPLPTDWDDVLCPRCRTRADRVAETYRQQQAATAHYEEPEDAFASAGPPPF